MNEVDTNPRLRVAPVAVEVQGRKMLLFQDPERITEETVLMPVEAAVFVQFFDGTRSVREIQAEITRQSGGQIIDTEIIEGIIRELDEHLLLMSPRFFAHVAELNEAWDAEPVRPAFLAGAGYPEDPAELKKFLDDFYLSPDGPGALPGPARANGLKGIIAPHMDIRESGPVIARAFKVLAEQTEARLFVIFGTGHMEAERMFVPSDKDYATPLGIARTDHDLFARLTHLRANRNPSNDYLHKQEHSIEFMVLFLQHALAGRGDFRILPILVSGMSPSVLAQEPPAADPSFREFCDALRRALAERNEPVCFIAGADLAHLGPRYGDRETWAPIRMAEEEELDRKMLNPLLSGDRDGFFREIAAIADRRRVCGFPPIYSLMETAGITRAEYLKWSYWHESESHSVVTFVSMALY